MIWLRKGLLLAILILELGLAAYLQVSRRIPLDDLLGADSFGTNQRILELGPEAFPSLLAGLAHRSPRVRTICLAYLGKLDMNEAAPAIVERLQDEAPEVRLMAAHSLQTVRSWKDDAPILKALRRPDEDQRTVSYLLTALERRLVREVLPEARRWAGDASRSNELRMTGIRTMGKLRDLDGIPTLEKVALGGDEPVLLRKRAAMYLGWLGAMRVPQEIVVSAEQPVMVRVGAVMGLNAATGEVWPACERLLSTLEADARQPAGVRTECIYTLFMHGLTPPHEFLKEALSGDPEPLVRQRAAWVIGRLRDYSLEEALQGAFEQEKDRGVRSAIRRAQQMLDSDDPP